MADSQSVTRDDLLQELAEFIEKEHGGRPGEDWFTTREIMDTNKMPIDQVRRIIRKLVAEGKLEEFRVNHQEVYYRKVNNPD